MARTTAIVFCILSCLASSAIADTGVLLPYNESEFLDPSLLTMEEMEVRIRIDHGMARVEMLQIYQSHSNRVLEGSYRMIIPESADIDGFAVWDDMVRIPGVILEKARARRIFDELARQQIDPGLLETDEEPTVVNEFTCRVVPINPYGAKRLELSYRLPLPIERGLLDFVMSLKPDDQEEQQVGRLVIDLEVRDDLPITALTFHGVTIVPEVTEQTENSFKAHFIAQDVNLTEDLAFTVEYQMPDTKLDLIAYRDLDHVDWNISPAGGGHFRDDTGYYQARLLFAPRESPEVGKRNIILVVDGSLSMLGDKLDRAVEMIDLLVRRFQATDKVTLVFANTQGIVSAGEPQPANEEWLAQVEGFLRAQNLAGGLDLAATLAQAGSLTLPGQANYVVLLSDGYATEGELRHAEIMKAVSESALMTNQARLFAVGVGDDANRTLLTDLAHLANGNYAWCADTADTGRLSETVAARMSAATLNDVELTFGNPDNIVDGYPMSIPTVFAGSEAVVVGRYRQPLADTVTLRYRPGLEAPVEKTFNITLPDKQADHEGIRRRWAKARVDFLLEQIRREGEKQEWIDEIITLSKRFTFVTPYTSFLAAPRALLRPRVIRPGDPILRVKTAGDVRAVTALFPFGLTAPLTYLADEDIWQVRFLAPAGFPDGQYICKLILTDSQGRQFVENKSFALDGRAPTVKAAMAPTVVAGRRARLAFYADADTRRLTARLPYTGSIALHWDGAAQANVGYLDIPAGAPPGKNRLELYAEDFAHNVSRTFVDLEVTNEN